MPARAAKLFFFLWILNHLLYPLWFPLDGDLRTAGILFTVLTSLAIGIALWLRPFLVNKTPEKESDDALSDLLSLPHDRTLWYLLFLIVAVRIYPLGLPMHIQDGGDEGVHMGLPALPFRLLARNLPIPYPLITWIVLGVLIYFRRKIAGTAREFFRAVIEGRPEAVGVAATLAGAYFLVAFEVIQYFLRSGHASFAADILRYPPLGKWVRLPAYALLGVSSFTGRLPEFAFFIATGLLVYKLMAEFRSKSEALIAAGLFWFLPPFAYYSIRGSQTQGEAFFFLLTCYFYVRWAIKGQISGLYWAALSVGIGSMYRYTVPLLGGVLAVMTLWPWPTRTKPPKRPPLRVFIECAVLLGLMVVPWMASYFLYKLRPYQPIQYQQSALSKLLVPAWTLPYAVSWPIALLFVLGLALVFVRKRDFLERYLLTWFAAYYVFIGMDAGEIIRLDMPMYLPLILWAAQAVFFVVRNEKWARRLGGALITYLLLITTILPGPGMHPDYTLFQGLKKEYLPLPAAAKELDKIPDGSNILAIDCSAGCFTMDLPRPHALNWTSVDSKNIRSMKELKRLCSDMKIDVVMYFAGTVDAFGYPENNRLFNEYIQPTDWLAPRRTFTLGENEIVFKNVLPHGP